MSLKRATWYGIAEAGAKGAAWSAILIAGYILSANQFAVIVLALGFEALATGAGVFGQDKLILLSKDNRTQNLHFQAGIRFILLTSSLLLIFIYLFNYAYDIFSFDTAAQPISLIWLCALAAGFRLQSAILRAQDAHTYFLISRAAFGIGRLFFVIIALLIYPSAVFVIFSMSLAYVAPIMIAFFGVAYRSKPNQKITVTTTAAALKRGIPFFSHMVSANLIAFGDRYVLAMFVDKYVLAAYGFWHTVVSATQFIYVALSSYFEKHIYREVPLGNNHTRDLFFFCGLSIVSFIGFFLVGFTSILNNETGHLRYSEAIILIPAFVLTAILQSFYFTICYSIIACNRNQAIGRSAIFAIVINITLLFFLGHLYSDSGIAFAKILAVIMVMAILLNQSKLMLSQVLPISKFIWITCFTLVFAVLGILNESTWANYWFISGVCIIFSLSSLYILRAIRKEST